MSSAIISRQNPLYEPRALWEVFTLDANDFTTATDVVRTSSTKRHWHNGGRYPLTITRLSFAPVGYAFKFLDGTFNDVYHRSEAAIERFRFFPSVRFRHHFSHYDLGIARMASRGSSEPGVRLTSQETISGNTYSNSGLFGLYRWAFDRPLRLPKLGVIDFQLSRPDLSFSNPPAYSTMFYEHVPNRFNGVCRVRDRAVVDCANNDSGRVWPGGPRVFTDVNPSVVSSGVAGSASNDIFGDPDVNFPPTDFKSQESNRALPMRDVTSFAVMIDQILYDNDLLNSGITGTITAGQVAQLGNSVRCAARTSHGGSGQEWWRRGAPLSLVTPTQGPAYTYEFDSPIILQPGEQFEFDLEVDNPQDLASVPSTLPIYQIGVSLTGFATIEG